MGGEPNQAFWRGIRPTDPAENIPVDVKAHTVDTPIVPASPEKIFTRYEPPEGTTFVQVNGSAVNVSTLIYTVPADTTLYLTDFVFSLYPVGVNGYGSLTVYDLVPAVFFRLSLLTCVANIGDSISGAFNIAVQIPANYTIYLASSAANVNAYGGFTGYLRSV